MKVQPREPDKSEGLQVRVASLNPRHFSAGSGSIKSAQWLTNFLAKRLVTKAQVLDLTYHYAQIRHKYPLLLLVIRFVIVR